jgi:hypothetical protein
MKNKKPLVFNGFWKAQKMPIAKALEITVNEACRYAVACMAVFAVGA